MVKVDGPEGGEPRLPVQIAPAKRLSEEARMRLIKSEGHVESPAIKGTRGKRIGRVRAFQSMLHGSLSCIQALMDSDFGKRNLGTATTHDGYGSSDTSGIGILEDVGVTMR
jgi:hypothetical protein